MNKSVCLISLNDRVLLTTGDVERIEQTEISKTRGIFFEMDDANEELVFSLEADNAIYGYDV